MPQIINGFMRVTFIEYYENDMPEDFSMISGIMFCTPFHYNIGTGAIKEFYGKIKNGIGDKYEITEINEISYYSVMIWDDVVKKASQESKLSWPSVNYQRLAIKELRMSLPSSEISVSSSNYIVRYIPILEVLETGDAYMMYPKSDTNEINSTPNPFLSPSEVASCTFGKTTSEYNFTPAIITFDTLSAVAMIAAVAMMLVLLMKRKTYLVETISLLPTILFLTGCLLGSASSFFFVTAPKSSIQCHFRLILMAYGWVFIISYQLSKALHFAKGRKGKSGKYTLKMYLLFFVPLFLLETTIIIVYFSVSPSK